MDFRDSEIQSNVIMRCSIQEELIKEEFIFVLYVFKFIVHVLTILYMYYPSLNKL